MSKLNLKEALNQSLTRTKQYIDTELAKKSDNSHTHNYAGSSSVGGAANSVKTNLVVKLNGGSTEGTNLFTFNGSTAKTVNITPSAIGAAPTNHASTATTYGAASASNYGHAMASSTTPKANGTAAVGSETAKFARGDHVHPLQTTVSGNAGSATKLQTARTINGTTFDGTANITTANWGTARKINQISVNGSADVKLPLDHYHCNVSDNNTNLYHHILASGQCTGDYTDKTILIVLNCQYNGGGFGIAKCSLRTNYASGGSTANGEIKWLVRSGFSENQLCFNIRNTAADTYMDVFYKSGGTYASLTWYVLNEGYRGNYSATTWTKNNTNASGTNAYTEAAMKTLRSYTSTLVSATDAGHVSSSNTANTCSGNAATATKVNNNLVVKLNGGSTEGTNLFTFNGSAAKTVNVTPSAIGAAASSHTHNYAGSSSAGGAATSANKVNTNLAIKLNGGTTEGTNLFTFNGSAAKTINITPSAIGAAASSHGTHLTIGTGASNAAAGNHTHTNVVNQDTRAVNTTPDGAPLGLSVHLKTNGTDSLSDGGTYHSSLFIKGWNDYSGGPYGNIAISANNNLWYRASSSGTAWNSWKKVSVDGHNHSNSYISKTTSTAIATASLNEPEIVNLDNDEIQAKVADYGLYRIATITTSNKAEKNNFAISMKVIASGAYETDLYIYFASGASDPDCESYVYTPGSYSVSCELYKRAANTWDLYVAYCDRTGGETAYILDVKNFGNFPITYYSSSQCVWASSLSSYTYESGSPRYSW